MSPSLRLSLCRLWSVYEPASRPFERVAPVARDQVEAHAAHLGFRREAAGFHRNFLHRRVVGGDRDELAAAALADVVLHPVVERRDLVQAAAVNGKPLAGELRSADVLGRARDAGNEDADLTGRFHPDRDRVEDVARHHLLLHDVLHVDGRRLSGDR